MKIVKLKAGTFASRVLPSPVKEASAGTIAQGSSRVLSTLTYTLSPSFTALANRPFWPSAPAMGRPWEHINLKYDYGKQDVASNLVLKADGTMSGAMSGTWSFDAGKQYLTLKTASKTVVVVVAREADWEASPRVATIVYAGTEKSLNATWWGKRVSD